VQYTKLTIALVGVLGVVGTSLADDFDKKTDLTVHETIMVPGKTLPPGKYVMKLLNATGNRHVVQIFNEDQTELQTTILAIPNYQVERKSDTVLTFWETPAGLPRALRAWFYPGDNFGQEFAYPKEEAERIARANSDAKVPQYAAQGDLNPDRISELDLENEPAPQVGLAERTRPEDTSRDSAISDRPANASEAPVAAAPPSDSDSNDVIAQNSPNPRPTLPGAQETVGGDRFNGEPTELPQTASPMPWVLLAGLLAIAGALTLRRLHA
jgi:LPXTG-motif cell wall-anchored protein